MASTIVDLGIQDRGCNESKHVALKSKTLAKLFVAVQCSDLDAVVVYALEGNEGYKYKSVESY